MVQESQMEQLATMITFMFQKIEREELKKNDLVSFLQALDPTMRSIFLTVTQKAESLPYKARFRMLDASQELKQEERREVEVRRI